MKEAQDNKFIELLKRYKELIKRLYNSAGYNNLRHLKQALLDLERFYLLLPSIAFTKENLIEDLLSCFFAISFELKKGMIIEDDIQKLFLYNPFMTEDKNSLFEKLRQKYSIQLNSFSLNADLWFEFFKEGTILEKDRLENSIKNSGYFYDENTPSWIKLWRWYDLNDEDFSMLFKNAFEKFQNKDIEDKYLLVHITAMFLYYSHLDLIPIDKAKVISIAKHNIADLKAKNKLSLEPHEGFPGEAYGSLGYHGRDMLEFKNFIEYFKKELQSSSVSNYPQIASELLLLMRDSPEIFKQKITLNNTSESRYFDTPILKYIKPKEFLKIFLALENKKKNFIGFALSERYKHGNFTKNLTQELDRLKEVTNELIKEKKKRIKKPSGFILNKIIDSDLQPSINLLEEVKSKTIPLV